MRSVVFFDLETTGLDPLKHEIIELAAIVCLLHGCGGFSMRERTHLKVAPQHLETADAKALAINGYSAAEWKQAASQLDMCLAFAELVAGAMAEEGGQPPMLAGHNVDFDIAFMKAAFEANGLKLPRVSHRKFDTMALAMPLFLYGEVESVSLDALCAHFGIGRARAHCAIDDVCATVELAHVLAGRVVNAERLGADCPCLETAPAKRRGERE